VWKGHCPGAQKVAGRPNSLAGWPYFAASSKLASRACSPVGCNKEYEARSQWMPHSVAVWPHGYAGRQTPIRSHELSGVFARASEVVSEIGEILYPYLSL
jgi:hypothetical protein